MNAQNNNIISSSSFVISLFYLQFPVVPCRVHDISRRRRRRHTHTTMWQSECEETSFYDCNWRMCGIFSAKEKSIPHSNLLDPLAIEEWTHMVQLIHTVLRTHAFWTKFSDGTGNMFLLFRESLSIILLHQIAQHTTKRMGAKQFLTNWQTIHFHFFGRLLVLWDAAAVATRVSISIYSSA